jgi:hypothetical protein
MFNIQILHTLILLRFPFSLFLMPIFLWALWYVPNPLSLRSLSVFIIFHILVYPASNGYNSLIDQDTEPIGGIAQPPPPPALLGPVTLSMDLTAIVWAGAIDFYFGAWIAFLIGMSRLYSAPWPRLKQYPWLSFGLVSLLQGAFTFEVALYGMGVSPHMLTQPMVLGSAAICTALVGSAYPLSQVFQHTEDKQRGDMTLSRWLGYRKTFLCSEILLGMALLGMITTQPRLLLWIFMGSMLPAGLYLVYWHQQVLQSERAASFSHSLRLNLFWAMGLNICFGLYCLI